MPIECSNWADRLLSRVTAVQPSLRILVSDRPAFIIGAMVKIIEPLINAGRPETQLLNHSCKAVTRDKRLSGQFEHSIRITYGDAEIFTLSPTVFSPPPYNG